MQVFVLLALIGLASLIGLAALAVVGIVRWLNRPAPEDDFDHALDAVTRLQADAWSAIQELRQLDGSQKGGE